MGRKAAIAEKNNSQPLKEGENDTSLKFNSLLNHKNRPIAVIVAPSRELAKQIYETAIKINKAATIETNLKSTENENQNVSGLDLRMKLVLGGNISERIETEDKYGVDVLVGTIGALHKMFAAKHYYAGSVCSLVLDEVDSLLDDTFGNLTASLIGKLCRVKSEVTEVLSLAGSRIAQSQLNSPTGETHSASWSNDAF